jgi:hypothetical protein
VDYVWDGAVSGTLAFGFLRVARPLQGELRADLTQLRRQRFAGMVRQILQLARDHPADQRAADGRVLGHQKKVAATSVSGGGSFARAIVMGGLDIK